MACIVARSRARARFLVIVRGTCFESLLAEAFKQVRHNAEGNVAVLARQLQVLETTAGQTANTRQRQAPGQQAELITAVAERTILTPHDRGVIHAASVCLAFAIDGPDGRPSSGEARFEGIP